MLDEIAEVYQEGNFPMNLAHELLSAFPEDKLDSLPVHDTSAMPDRVPFLSFAWFQKGRKAYPWTNASKLKGDKCGVHTVYYTLQSHSLR